jgi:hypothetical protein
MLFGVAFFSHQVGGFMGSWLGGVSFDMTGSYTVAWVAMIVIGLTAAAIQWMMDDRLLPGSGLQNPGLPQPSAAWRAQQPRNLAIVVSVEPSLLSAKASSSNRRAASGTRSCICARRPSAF